MPSMQAQSQPVAFRVPEIWGRLRTTKSFHGYTPATRFRPEWTPAFLVFQGGIPVTKHASITGGGQIYGHEFRAMRANMPNVIAAQAPGVYSITGGGQIPYDPAFLQPLAGGAAGVGS